MSAVIFLSNEPGVRAQDAARYATVSRTFTSNICVIRKKAAYVRIVHQVYTLFLLLVLAFVTYHPSFPSLDLGTVVLIFSFLHFHVVRCQTVNSRPTNEDMMILTREQPHIARRILALPPVVRRGLYLHDLVALAERELVVLRGVVAVDGLIVSLIDRT